MSPAVKYDDYREWVTFPGECIGSRVQAASSQLWPLDCLLCSSTGVCQQQHDLLFVLTASRQKWY